jgi:hypothetical protein
MSGTLTYWVREGGGRYRSVRLTVLGRDEVPGAGLADRRRRRLGRILAEATRQGARLSYRDLSMIMLSSKATLKRDVSTLRKRGIQVPVGPRASN